MIKTLFIALALALTPMAAMATIEDSYNHFTVVADVCTTPSQTVEQLDNLAKMNNFQHEVDTYTGEKAAAIKNAIEAKIGQKVVDFDTILLGHRENYDKVYAALYKNGCKLLETIIPTQDYYDLKRAGDGI